MKTTKIKIKKLSDLAIIPERGSEYSAGVDLHAAISESIYISPHETIKIPTGLAMELPEGTFGAIFARSGLATKEGLAPATKVSVIDSDYRGEIGVPLHTTLICLDLSIQENVLHNWYYCLMFQSNLRK